MPSERNSKKIVSFDFDGVLHLDVDDHGNPIDYNDDDPTPNIDMINLMRDEQKAGNDIVIVTKRDETDTIWTFVNRYHLPVMDVVATRCAPKLPFLRDIGNVVRHYDDSDHVMAEKRKKGDPKMIHVVDGVPV